MNFVLLIAVDTVRAIRRHRVVLAFVLLALVGMGFVTSGIRNATRHAEHLEQAQARAGQSATPESSRREARVRRLEERLQKTEVFFQGFFAFAIAELGSLLALLVFCTAVTSEVKTGTIRVTLAKPVPRGAYLTGKWLGAAAVLGAYSAVGGLALGALALTYGEQTIGATCAIAWLSFCGSVVTGTVGLCYSLFVRAPVAGVLAWFTSASWVPGIPLLYAILPSYEPFSVASLAFQGISIQSWQMTMATLYAADLVAILLLVAAARFRHMEIA